MMEVTVVATIKLCMFYCELAGNAIEDKWDNSQKKKKGSVTGKIWWIFNILR